MEQVMLDMIPTGAKAVCHVSQYDVGRTIRFNLRSGGAAYTLSGTETIKVYIMKPDGTTAERNIANTSSTYVDWVTGEGDCDQAGKCECELVITSGTTVIGSKNFTVKIEEDPYNEQGVVTETAGPAVIATFTTNIVDLLQEVKCSINPIQDLHGYDHPWPAGGGVNLFDKANTFEGYIIDTNGNFSSRTGDVATDFISVVGGTSYYVKSEQESGMWGAWYNENKEFISACTGYANRVITAPTNAKFVRLTVVHNSGNSDTFGINYPATDTSYYPYENVCPIEGYTEANITRCGVNLFDDNKLVIASYPYSSMTFDKATYLKAGTYTASISNVENASSWRFGFRFFNADGTIITNAITNGLVTLTSAMAFSDAYDSNQTCLMAADTNTTTVVINLTQGAYIVGCISNGNVGASTTLDYQIELGSTAMEFIPYTGNTYTIAIGQEVFGGQLIILPDRTYFHATHGFKVYDGSENWSLNTPTKPWLFSVNAPTNIKQGSASSLYEISNLFKATSEIWASSGYGILNNFNNLLVGYPVANSDANILKSFLDSNNLQVCYQLETQFDIDLTPQQIEALIGVNNVWHDGNGNTEVKYLYNA